MEDLGEEPLRRVCSVRGGGPLITEGGVVHPCASGSSCHRRNRPADFQGWNPPRTPHAAPGQGGESPRLPRHSLQLEEKTEAPPHI